MPKKKRWKREKKITASTRIPSLERREGLSERWKDKQMER